MVNRKFVNLNQIITILSWCIMVFLAFNCCRVLANDTAQNTLSDEEKKDGWQLLWDGLSESPISRILRVRVE